MCKEVYKDELLSIKDKTDYNMEVINIETTNDLDIHDLELIDIYKKNEESILHIIQVAGWLFAFYSSLFYIYNKYFNFN